MRALVAHIGHVNIEVLSELVFHRQVPLLRVRKMPFVELAVYTRIFPVVVRQVEKGRRLVLRAGETLAEKGAGSDTAVAGTENNISVETVAPTAHAGVPPRIAQRLIENTVAPSNHRLGVNRICQSKTRCEIVHIRRFRIGLAETGGIAATSNVTRKNQRTGQSACPRIRKRRIDEGKVIVFVPRRRGNVPADAQVKG